MRRIITAITAAAAITRRERYACANFRPNAQENRAIIATDDIAHRTCRDTYCKVSTQKFVFVARSKQLERKRVFNSRRLANFSRRTIVFRFNFLKLNGRIFR